MSSTPQSAASVEKLGVLPARKSPTVRSCKLSVWALRADQATASINVRMSFLKDRLATARIRNASPPDARGASLRIEDGLIDQVADDRPLDRVRQVEREHQSSKSRRHRAHDGRIAERLLDDVALFSRVLIEA